MSSREISLDEMLIEALRIESKPLLEVLSDRYLARLGDAYINFVCSLAATIKNGKPSGVKMSNKILAQALRISGLRAKMPKRLSQHELGSSAEALLLYSTTRKMISTDEIIESLVENENPEMALAEIFKRITEKWQKQLLLDSELNVK